jgi:hypothetical protein
MPLHSNYPSKPEREEPRNLGGAGSEGRHQVEVGLAALNNSSVLVVGRPARGELKVAIDNLHLNQQINLISLPVDVLRSLRLDLSLQVCEVELHATNHGDLPLFLDVEAHIEVVSLTPLFTQYAMNAVLM